MHGIDKVPYKLPNIGTEFHEPYAFLKMPSALFMLEPFLPIALPMSFSCTMKSRGSFGSLTMQSFTLEFVKDSKIEIYWIMSALYLIRSNFSYAPFITEMTEIEKGFLHITPSSSLLYPTFTVSVLLKPA